MSLRTDNKKIIQFYETHPNIDFEKTNLLIIDLFEYILREKNENSDSLLTYLQNVEQSISSMNNELKQSSQQIINLQTSVSDLPSQMDNNVSSQLSNIRENYVKELERTIQSSSSQQQQLLQTIIQENINDIMSSEKITERFNENMKSKFDSLQQFIMTSHNQLKENEISNRESLSMIQTYFNRQKNSTCKGIDSENKVEQLLNDTFPDACIQNTTGQSKSCDFLLSRVDKNDIMIENKDYSSNIPIHEVEKFIRDIEHNNKSGIFISQQSGIARKQNFQIDIHNNCVLIYIHNVNYDFEKVKLAVHTIDYITDVLQDLNYENEDFKISMEILKDINKEYQHFLFQRNSLSDTLKKFNKDMIKQISSLEMTSLQTMLSKHFSSTEATLFKCSYCNMKQFKNAKALAAHTKKCKKENESQIKIE